MLNPQWFVVGFQLGQAACAAWENEHSNLNRLYARLDKSPKLNELAERRLIPGVITLRSKLAARFTPDTIPADWS